MRFLLLVFILLTIVSAAHHASSMTVGDALDQLLLSRRTPARTGVDLVAPNHLAARSARTVGDSSWGIALKEKVDEGFAFYNTNLAHRVIIAPKKCKRAKLVRHVQRTETTLKGHFSAFSKALQQEDSNSPRQKAQVTKIARFISMNVNKLRRQLSLLATLENCV
ncbi:hypothetical protein HDV05_004507 [Chytridiales sp. JEL 0842]|nr:hypothetical protein HDV05_004507 [Chytridiales sp. JEL 0842]